MIRLDVQRFGPVLTSATTYVSCRWPGAPATSPSGGCSSWHSARWSDSTTGPGGSWLTTPGPSLFVHLERGTVYAWRRWWRSSCGGTTSFRTRPCQTAAGTASRVAPGLRTTSTCCCPAPTARRARGRPPWPVGLPFPRAEPRRLPALGHRVDECGQPGVLHSTGRCNWFAVTGAVSAGATPVSRRPLLRGR